MHAVEQAIFALRDSDHSAGYQVVARSAGVCEADARELAVWGPTHDSMLASNPETESVNFHPLPSGAHCVSITSWVDWNHSGMGRSVSTRCLIVPPDVLARFGNSPFALLRAATADGAWQRGDLRGTTLDPLAITGGAAPVDQPLLTQLAADPGPANMAALVQSACEVMFLAVSGTRRPAELIAGLFSCLPPECRPEFSFSTGLKFSPRRPFRIVALSGDPAQQQWVAHYPGVAVLELRGKGLPSTVPLDGWAQFIERTLAADRIAFLTAQASKRRFHLTLDDLPALGLQLLEELDDAELGDHENLDKAAWQAPSLRGRQAHAAHHQFSKSIDAVLATPTTASSVAPPSTALDPGSPAVLEQLELLDDLVYEAIGGRSDTMEQLREVWPQLVAELGEPLLAESREQYLRYALSIWEECTDADGVRHPSRVIQALDVLCLLFGDAT
jgi:hypothetical protein